MVVWKNPVGIKIKFIFLKIVAGQYIFCSLFNIYYKTFCESGLKHFHKRLMPETLVRYRFLVVSKLRNMPTTPVAVAGLLSLM